MSRAPTLCLIVLFALAAGCGRRSAPVTGTLHADDLAPTTEEPEPPNPPDPVMPPEPQPGPTPTPVTPPEPQGEPVGAMCEFENPLTPLSMLLNPSSESCATSLCLYTGTDVPRCTDFCGGDSDCPQDSESCPEGFVCVARFAVGPPACCRLCICRRALHPLEQKDLFSCHDRTCDFSVPE